MTGRRSINNKAREYLKSIEGDTSFLNLSQCIRYLGWRVYFFNGKDDPGDSIITALEKAEYAKNKRSFLAVSETERFIFIRSQQSDSNARFYLLHEIGHILLGHLGYSETVINATTNKEAEANQFARYVLNHGHGKNKRRRRTIIVAVVMLLFIAYYQTDKQKQRTPAYFAEGGTSYHRQVCTYTAGNDRIIETTIKDAEQLGLEPCPVCQHKPE